MLNFPVASVTAVREKPLTGFRASTVAFGITAPEGSTTTPVIDVERPD